MMKNKILKNIFSHHVGKIFEIALGVLLVPFMIKKVGVSGFGIVVLAETIFYFFDFSLAGLRGAIGRYAALALYGNDKMQANRYLSTGSCMLVVSLVVMVTIFIGAAGHLHSILNIPDQFKDQTHRFMLGMLLSLVVHLSFTPYWAIIYAFQRFDLQNLFMGVRNVVRGVLVFVVYSTLPPKLYYYGFIYLCAIIVEQLLINRSARRLLPELLIRASLFSWRDAGKLFAFMTFRTIQSVSALLYSRTHMVLINRYMGAAFNTLYDISLKFVSLLQRMIQQALWVLVPSFTELIALGDSKNLNRITAGMTKAVAIVTLPICILMALFGKELLVAWVGPEFIAAVRPMYFNILYVIPIIVFTPSDTVLAAFAKIKIPSFVNLACACANIAIGLFTAIKLRWGLTGFAFGSCCATLIQSAIFIPYYSCLVSGMDRRNFYVNSVAKPVTLNGALASVLFYEKFIMKTPLYGMIASIAVAMPVYCGLAYIFLLNREERRMLRDSRRHIVAKVSAIRLRPDAVSSEE